MNNIATLSRKDYLILQSLYKESCTDCFCGMTIAGIMSVLPDKTFANVTVWRSTQKLSEMGYIAKGFREFHADTFYLLDKGIEICEHGRRD